MGNKEGSPSLIIFGGLPKNRDRCGPSSVVYLYLRTMKSIYAKNRKEFRKWLEKNHDKETEVSLVYYKVNSGKPSINWEESVEEALCFGWIDGVRRSVDEESYCIRFTPRKPKSIWSLININKVEKLIKEGLMTQAGLKAYEHGKKHGEIDKAYSLKAENPLPEELKTALKKNKKAWEFFQKLSNTDKFSYIAHSSLKTADKRAERIAKIVKLCSLHIKPYSDGKKSVMREDI